ncbi:hypothetical protein LCGC14_0554850 [marine sediment metagenome]|uniref:Ku domain-containing protein n=1 Tax=marine sediment metagenome TaxID=412755 RepID=A0A0F9RNK2_9ZZZZ
MGPKAVWKGAVGFGMVSIPVRLTSGTEEKKVSFNQLHGPCNGRIQQPKWCPTCDCKAESEDIIKGYPVGDDQYVIMEEADFAGLPVKSLKSIDVVAFVDGSAIDPRHYNKSYLMAPEDAGLKAFSLFIQAMTRANVVGIAKLGFREREHLAAIRAFGEVILLQTLFYADELRDPGDVAKPMAVCSQQEMEMAIALIKSLAADDPNLGQYKDEYRETLTQVIQAKLDGTVIVAAPTTEAPKMDLVDALMASIAAKPADTEEPVGELATRIGELAETEEDLWKP